MAPRRQATPCANLFSVVRSSRLISRVIWWCCAALLLTQLFGIHAHRVDATAAHGHSHFEWHFAHSGLYALDSSDSNSGAEDTSGHGDSNADGLKSFVMKTLGTLAVALPAMALLLSPPLTQPVRLALQHSQRIVARTPRYSIKPPTQAPPLR
jgi:hypothetical protein